jgi:hypothetical protein
MLGLVGINTTSPEVRFRLSLDPGAPMHVALALVDAAR